MLGMVNHFQVSNFHSMVNERKSFSRLSFKKPHSLPATFNKRISTAQKTVSFLQPEVDTIHALCYICK